MTVGRGQPRPCRKKHEVFAASTGVIGEPWTRRSFAHLLSGLAEAATADRFEDAARAIMTTDTYVKLATRSVRTVTSM